MSLTFMSDIDSKMMLNTDPDRLSSRVIDIDSPGIPQDAPEQRIYLTIESKLYGEGHDTFKTQEYKSQYSKDIKSFT